jgi:spore germination protein
VYVIPPNKIMMGIPNYGYDWTLPYIEGGSFAEGLVNQEAAERAVKYT